MPPVLDLTTLLTVTVFVMVVTGMLLQFSWLQNRGMTELAMWGTGFLLIAAGGGLQCLRNTVSPIWSIDAGNALVLLGYGAMWAGARSFEGRNRPAFWQIAAGAVFWVAACRIDSFYASLQSRIMVASALVAIYSLLIISELWHARHKELMSRWPTLIVMMAQTAFFIARVPLAGVIPFPTTDGAPGIHPEWFPIGMFGTLILSVCMAFLVVNMAKERAELQHRQAAMADPLTGVANRRAFFEYGERLLRRMSDRRQGGALLLFDLDHFKAINDTFGHQTGDRVLMNFCNEAGQELRPRDLFGRIGGEEFACLLPKTAPAEALAIAERIRSRFEFARVPPYGPAATVSIGIATSGSGEGDIQALLAIADRALYRAKNKGRNRVELPRPALAVVNAANAAG